MLENVSHVPGTQFGFKNHPGPHHTITLKMESLLFTVTEHLRPTAVATSCEIIRSFSLQKRQINDVFFCAISGNKRGRTDNPGRGSLWLPPSIGLMKDTRLPVSMTPRLLCCLSGDDGDITIPFSHIMARHVHPHVHAVLQHWLLNKYMFFKILDK